jgi:predicted short-subunit dehydrogenase-like oxidoreductase (DUF2520 family)
MARVGAVIKTAAAAAIALGAARALAKPFKRGDPLRVVSNLVGSLAG